MPILKVAKIGHPILIKKAKKIENISESSLNRLIIDMSHTLIDANGIGLAAPQIYVSKRIIIFRSNKNNKKNEIKKNNKMKIHILALINPSYEVIGNEFEDDWEGCLSIPDMIGKVRRFKKIKYKGYDIKGNLIQKKASGLLARVIQHECDHLDGILYISRLVHPNYFGYAEEFKRYLKNEKSKKSSE